MVECAGLETGIRFHRVEGSNPSFSANERAAREAAFRAAAFTDLYPCAIPSSPPRRASRSMGRTGLLKGARDVAYRNRRRPPQRGPARHEVDVVGHGGRGGAFALSAWAQPAGPGPSMHGMHGMAEPGMMMGGGRGGGSHARRPERQRGAARQIRQIFKAAADDLRGQREQRHCAARAWPAGFKAAPTVDAAAAEQLRQQIRRCTSRPNACCRPCSTPARCSRPSSRRLAERMNNAARSCASYGSHAARASAPVMRTGAAVRSVTLVWRHELTRAPDRRRRPPPSMVGDYLRHAGFEVSTAGSLAAGRERLAAETMPCCST